MRTAWVFTRSASTWTQQGPKLTGSGETGEGRFGVAVALSADGNTALVVALSADGNTALIGAWRDNSGTGAAWAFVNEPAEPEPPTTEPTIPRPPCCDPGPGEPRVLLVQSVRQSARKWREGNRLAIVSRAKTPVGTTFSFSLNEEVTLTFSFTRRVSGRTVTAGKLTFTGHDGTNKVAFQGRISPKKKLEPGRYQLVITATDSAGARSAPKSLDFTIVK